MSALLSSADKGSAPSVRALSDLRLVQREASAAFRLAIRPCRCSSRKLVWYMLGMADYLMEEVLLQSANGESSITEQSREEHQQQKKEVR